MYETLYFDLSYTKTGIFVYETLYFDLPSQCDNPNLPMSINNDDVWPFHIKCLSLYHVLHNYERRAYHIWQKVQAVRV